VTDALEGCRLKLDWAEKHLGALTGEMKTFVESEGPQTFPTKHDKANQTTTVFFREWRKIPPEWGVAIGDVIHNTRSALDHLVYQLVVLNRATPHEVHQFPVLDSPRDWNRRVQNPPKGRRGLLDYIDPAQIARIQALQPYMPNTGLPRLAVLRDFSNVDKHRLIHAARTTFVGVPKVSASLEIPYTLSELWSIPPGTILEDGDEIARFHAGLEIKIGEQLGNPVDDAPGAKSWAPVLPPNSDVHWMAEADITIVFGAPGVEYTRWREFQEAIDDVRRVVDSFVRWF